MNKLATTIAALALIGTPALAADMARKMPVKAPPPPPAPVYSWTGWYVGATAGAAWGSFDPVTSTFSVPGGYFQTSSVPAVNAAGVQSIKPSGFTGGIEAGYNWQTGPLVVGLEADFEYLGLRGSSSNGAIYPCCAPTGFNIATSAKTDWLFTGRPRIGFANNNWLFYATGGVAVTDLHGNFNFTDNNSAATASGSFSSTKVGYAVGGGVEAGLWSQWTIKAEYLFVDFGRVSTTSNNLVTPAFGAFPATVFTHSLDLKANIVRVGLNYQFH
jgi:outer membrane immunogenic protein